MMCNGGEKRGRETQPKNTDNNVNRQCTCYKTTTTTIERSLFQDNLGIQHQKDRTILDFNEVRDDGRAMASNVPYANHLYLKTDNHASTSSLSFLQARCSS